MNKQFESYLYKSHLYDIMQLSVRDVDENVFRAFKAKAVEENLPVGRAVSLALKHWLDESKKKKSFLELKPWNWGKGTEQLSSQIDEVLYG